ncbi:MAG: HAMP domain-containing histidine kinase [Planctomycetes bacterium]|nr:HAMP domain-containing histidine kinase [Planctomycetota bacterium]
MSLRAALLAGAASLAVGGALALLTASVVRSDREARTGEAVRLALWRLDARATALVVAEAGRAPGSWRSFVPGEDAAGRAVLLPSPLLPLPPAPVYLHLLVRPGSVDSPQVPSSARRHLAAGLVDPAGLAEAERRLAALRGRLAGAGGIERLLAGLPALDGHPGEARKLERELGPGSLAAGGAAEGGPIPAPAVVVQGNERMDPFVDHERNESLAAAAAPAAPPAPHPPAAAKPAANLAEAAAVPAAAMAAPQAARARGMAASALAEEDEAKRISTPAADLDEVAGAPTAAVAPPLAARPRVKAGSAPAEEAALAKRDAVAPAARSQGMVGAAAAPALADAGQDLQARQLVVEQLQRQATVNQQHAVFTRRAAETGSDKPAAKTRTRQADAKRAAEPPLRTDLGADEAGPVTARWLDGDLLLARRLRLDGAEAVGAAVVTWPPLAAELTAAIADLLPAARLHPARPGDATVLAALPVALDPGPLPAIALGGTARWTLLAAWIAGLGGLAAALAVAWAAHRLAERRAAFVSAVTHELRTPLTALRLHGDLLADTRIAGDPARRAGPVAAVRGEAARLAHLIDNVLDYARLERRRPPQPRPLPLDELLAPLLPRLGERLAASGLTLASAPLPPALVACDPAAVERILANLADNAAKYATGGSSPTVEFAVLLAGGHVELRLRDHGPGLAADVRQRLFVPFARSAEAAAGSAPGVGLGLALCRRLARAQGGDLRLEDADGGGCVATLALPLAG